MKRFAVSFVLVFMLGLFVASSACATTIDFWSLFPQNTQGQNNCYLYGYSYGASTPAYRELTYISDYYFGTPTAIEFNIPYVSKGSSSWINMHPAANSDNKDPNLPNESAVFAYKVPYDITGVLSGVFASANSGSKIGYIWQNDSLLWSAGLSGSSSSSFSKDVTLQADDFLYFGVNPNGDDYSDGTKFWANLTYENGAVPEPTTMLMLFSGILGFGFFKKRK